jgi:hypothetical protein
MKLKILTGVLALTTCMVGAKATAPEPAAIKAADGWLIFDPTKDGQAYRFEPSMIINPITFNKL